MIRVDLTLPVLRLGVGPFAINPLEHLVGEKLSDLLEPLMTAPCTERRTAAGVLVDVYPLALPDGEGATVPLGTWGELGLFNDRSLLMLSLPAIAAPWVAARLGEALVRGPEPTGSTNGRRRVASVWARLRPGACAVFPLGSFGEISIVATEIGGP